VNRLKFGQPERRSLTSTVELRAADGESQKIVGQALEYNSQSQLIWGLFRERFMPGAFADTIKNDDIRCLWQHDTALVLGRNTRGTLILVETDTALTYECDPPQTTWANDALESIRRGDVSGSSFWFYEPEDEWTENPDGTYLRTIHKARLYEVSPVTFPAYESSNVSLRSMPQEFESIKQTVPPKIFKRMIEAQIENLRQLLTEQEPEQRGDLLILRRRLELEALSI
jgi:uncharacterized protein